MLGAMIAAMSVQWTVSRAVAQGLITEHLPFARTSKGGLSVMSIEFQAFWEAVIGVLLLVGAAVLIVNNNSTLIKVTGNKQIREIYVFAAVLVLESLPFLSAVAIAILENSRINSFAFWRNSAVRTAELIGLRPVTMPTVASPSPPVAWEIHRDSWRASGARGSIGLGRLEEAALTVSCAKGIWDGWPAHLRPFALLTVNAPPPTQRGPSMIRKNAHPARRSRAGPAFRKDHAQATE